LSVTQVKNLTAQKSFSSLAQKCFVCCKMLVHYKRSFGIQLYFASGLTLIPVGGNQPI